MKVITIIEANLYQATNGNLYAGKGLNFFWRLLNTGLLNNSPESYIDGVTFLKKIKITKIGNSFYHNQKI